MIGYIRNAQTFENIKTVDVIDYNLPVEVPSGYTGTIKIVKTEGKFQNYIISVEDETFTGTDAWYITGQDTEIGEEITLTVTDVWGAFYGKDYMQYVEGADDVNFIESALERFVGIRKDKKTIDGETVRCQKQLEIKHSKYSVKNSILNSILGSKWINCELVDADDSTTGTYRIAVSLIIKNAQYDRNDFATLIASHLPGGSSDLYLVDFHKLRNVLYSNGFFLKAEIRPTIVDYYKITGPTIGEGIEYNGTKYRIISASAGLDCVIDDTVTCQYYAIKPPLQHLQRPDVFIYGENKLRRKDGILTPVLSEVQAPSIYVDIDRTNQTPIPVYFGDGHSELLSQKYDDSDIVTFVLLIYRLQNSGMDYVRTLYYYLTEDANITDDESLQGQGTSDVVQIGKKTELLSWQDGLQYVEDIFLKNEWKHKIEFASDKEFHLGQPVRLVLDRGILDTTISSVYKKSSDNRYIYTCGDLPLTASEQIKDNSWSYGRRLPLNPVKGQLAFD